MKHFLRLAIITSLLILTNCQIQNDINDNRLIAFKDRQIDLKPYVDEFPFLRYDPFYDAGKLYYLHEDSITTMKEIPLSENIDLNEGISISDIDFSKRNISNIRYRKNDKHLYFKCDEVNKEVFNLYKLNPATKEVHKLTDVPYIYGWRWDKLKNQIAYVARLGVRDKRLGELRILNLENLQEKTITKDNPEFRFTWGHPSWQPDGKGVVVPVVKNGDRKFRNLIYIDLKSNEWTMITNSDKIRSSVSVDSKWLNNNELIYYSNEDGFRNIYRYNLVSRKAKQITKYKKDLYSAYVMIIEDKKYIFSIVDNPIESEIQLIDPNTSEVINSEKKDFYLEILDYKDDRLLINSLSATNYFRMDELIISKEKFTFKTILDIPENLKTKIVHSSTERIEFPTFDIDPKTGETRMLHAFLYHPKNPLPKDQQIAMIKSFYGGWNIYEMQIQILTEAGIYVLSPSPRGSTGFGREFHSLNDKDLGGNEIIDIIYAGKYLSEKLEIPPSRIGVFGNSHGGYATMRLLTFPGEVNNHKAQFNWGFGISSAGFSDIIHFHDNCNIPDWVTLEAGDPKTETDKLKDRSPIYHADKMFGKLLLTHGTNDSRVPIEGSRFMADSLRKYQKDITLVEFEGQGHRVKGLENTIVRYRAWFDFLNTIK